jgi:hypothetical protein
VGADIHAIAEKLIHFMVAHEHYCERNYRGIEGLFANKVVGHILKQMPEPRPSVPFLLPSLVFFCFYTSRALADAVGNEGVPAQAATALRLIAFPVLR